jgi:hypothetical protein
MAKTTVLSDIGSFLSKIEAFVNKEVKGVENVLKNFTTNILPVLETVEKDIMAIASTLAAGDPLLGEIEALLQSIISIKGQLK